MLKWKRVVLVSERWRNSEWKLLLLARVGVGGLLIFHIVRKKHFYLIFAGVSGAWWDGRASFEAPADLMGFTFIFFSLLFTRRSTKGNCQSVPIRSFQVGRVQCAGANSATKPLLPVFSFFFLFLVFFFLNVNLYISPAVALVVHWVSLNLTHWTFAERSRSGRTR